MSAPRLLLSAVLVLAPAVLAAQRPLPADYEAARLAWDGGDYVVALDAFDRLLRSSDGERYVEPIALLTGELFHVTELTSDGRAPQLSANGRVALFESGADTDRAIHVWRLEGRPARLAEVSGMSGALSPSGDRLAYVVVRETPELQAARESVAALDPADRQRLFAAQAQLAWLEALTSRLVIRDLATGREREIVGPELIAATPAFSHDGSTVYFVGASPETDGRTDIYRVPAAGGRATALTSADGFRGEPTVVAGGTHLVYAMPSRSPLPQRPSAGGPPRGGPAGATGFAILDLASASERRIAGGSPSVSANGARLAYITRGDDGSTLHIMDLRGGEPAAIRRSESRLDAPALSSTGDRVVFQMMTKDDWELYLADASGANERRLTREIQHDLMPRFLDDTTILGVIGEGRHRRSHLYDARTGERRRLFHNNTVRTIAPEYQWIPSRDGRRVLIVAERDGDTVSPERGIYLVDLGRRVTRDELLGRIAVGRAAESALRAAGERAFAPIADDVRRVLADVSIAKLYEYQKSLFDFDSKHITRPGNAPAAQYLLETLKSFGYEPQLQWFEARAGGNNIRTANVLATLRGTENPELIYVLSSHFDSHASGPGADDNTSGTSVLVEAARVLAQRPQPATIIFAAMTGEESGLLGSREFVRQAVARGDHLVGALNNDMLGWSNDHRLDNTIRYSNPGIRDLQHAAAFLFTDLITHDALYYKSTDAAAFYEAYGDIVGGIGSYPVLGNPHYHQPTDRLETINQELVRETAKTTTASLMMLASSPSRLTGLRATSDGRASIVAWTPSPEKGVSGYIVAYGPAGDPMRHRVTVTEARVTLPNAEPGWNVAVKAVNARGLEGWDWAKTTITR